MNSHATLLPLAIMAVTLPVCSTARAADSCHAVFDALTKSVTIPSHSYTTSTSAGRALEAETIYANGQKYIRVHGKWMRLPVTTQDVLKQEKEKEEHGKSACSLVRSEAVNGEAAMLYSLRREYGEVTENGQIWISKGSGLPLRVEEDVDNQVKKAREHRSTRFEYGNIRPPV